MTLRFKAIKASLVLAIIFFSMFLVYIPSTSAGIVGLSSYIDVTWPANETEKPSDLLHYFLSRACIRIC